VKSWVGMVVLLYFGALALLAAPLLWICFIGKRHGGWLEDLTWAWGVAAVFAAGQAVLLAVPADLARERPVARRRLLIPVIATGIFLCLLMLAGLGSLLLAITGDKADREIGTTLLCLIPLPFLWSVWAWVFYVFFKTDDSGRLVTRLMKGLLRGSVLELLVAVPSHVIVRHRDDCCAPSVTFIGIATGLSMMLMSFGPGVLFLFARRFRELRRAQGGPPAPEDPAAAKGRE
jgi:hypothetical protein